MERRCIFLPAKAREYVLPALVCMSACLCVCVCLSVTTITKNIVDGFVPNFMGRFLGGKRRPKFVFRYDWWRDVEVTVKKLRKPAIVYILYF